LKDDERVLEPSVCLNAHLGLDLSAELGNRGMVKEESPSRGNREFGSFWSYHYICCPHDHDGRANRSHIIRQWFVQPCTEQEVPCCSPQKRAYRVLGCASPEIPFHTHRYQVDDGRSARSSLPVPSPDMHLAKTAVVLLLDLRARTALLHRTWTQLADLAGRVAGYDSVLRHILRDMHVSEAALIIYRAGKRRRNTADQECRAAMEEGTYPCHDRAGSHDGSFADGAVWEDDRVATNEDVVFNYDCAARERALASLSRCSVNARCVAVEFDVRANDDAVANDDLAWILHVAACAYDGVVAEADVVAIVAVEWRLDESAVAYLSGTNGVCRSFAIVVIYPLTFRWVDDGSEEASTFFCADSFRRSRGVVVAFDCCFALQAITE